MYIAVYPVALSIRSTNVYVHVLQLFFLASRFIYIFPNSYEERSLGVFEAPPDDEDEEPNDINNLKTRRERIGRYLGWHLRRQMSIGWSLEMSLFFHSTECLLDIWWLVWGVLLVSIIERANLLDESKKWFDLFRVLFELVSAFGGIGLSLGFPSV